jgi:diguanylate cyclase (GGDEF)-like protein
MNLVARFGGDEFISILSDTDEAGGEQYARRIRKSMASDKVLGPASVSVAYGMARFVPEMDTGEDLIQAADADLYQSKARRDRPASDPADPTA